MFLRICNWKQIRIYVILRKKIHNRSLRFLRTLHMISSENVIRQKYASVATVLAMQGWRPVLAHQKSTNWKKILNMQYLCDTNLRLWQKVRRTIAIPFGENLILNKCSIFHLTEYFGMNGSYCLHITIWLKWNRFLLKIHCFLCSKNRRLLWLMKCSESFIQSMKSAQFSCEISPKIPFEKNLLAILAKNRWNLQISSSDVRFFFKNNRKQLRITWCVERLSELCLKKSALSKDL